MLYTINKGSNKSFPLVPVFSNLGQRNFEFEITFNEDCLYPQQIINGVVYDGYNKACGIAFRLFKPNQDAAMLGWRCYNGKLYVVPYFNVDGKNIYGTKETEVQVDSSIMVKIDVLDTEVMILIKHKDDILEQTQVFRKMFGFLKIVHLINFWFGGQLPANQNVSAEIICL